MAFWDDEASLFIAEFAQEVSYGETVFLGVLDERPTVLEGVVSKDPLLSVKATDASSLSPGDILTISSVSYYIMRIEENDGIATIQLSKDTVK